MIIQQGDVVLELGVIPSGCEAMKGNVVQYGEHTGHGHRLFDGEFEMLQHPETKKRYLRLVSPTALRHEEHKEIQLPSGDFEIRIVKEYDHFTEESREVLD